MTKKRTRCHPTVLRLTTIALMFILSSAMFVSATTIQHLTYGSHAAEWHEWLELMAERFYDETGIEVLVETGPSGRAYREQIIVRTGAGLPPDVMDFNPNQAAILVREGVFEDLRPYVENSDIDLSLYPPVGIEGMTAPDGTMWGFAVSLLPIPVYFNVDMMENAGLVTPDRLGEDWTWETYTAYARQLTRRDADGTATQFGTIDQRFRWEQIVHQAGGQVYDRLVFPTKSYFNSPEVLAGFEFRQTMFDEGLIATTGGVWAGNTALTMIDPPTIINKYEGGFEMDVAMQPKGPGGRGGVVNPDGFQIHTHSENKEAAWQWIHFLVTDVDGLMDFTRLTGRLPSLRHAMQRYNEVVHTLPSNWQALINSAFSPDAYPTYMVPSAAIKELLDEELDKIWKGIEPPATVLQRIHNRVEAILREEESF